MSDVAYFILLHAFAVVGFFTVGRWLGIQCAKALLGREEVRKLQREFEQ